MQRDQAALPLCMPSYLPRPQLWCVHASFLTVCPPPRCVVAQSESHPEPSCMTPFKPPPGCTLIGRAAAAAPPPDPAAFTTTRRACSPRMVTYSGSSHSCRCARCAPAARGPSPSPTSGLRAPQLAYTPVSGVLRASPPLEPWTVAAAASSSQQPGCGKSGGRRQPGLSPPNPASSPSIPRPDPQPPGTQVDDEPPLPPPGMAPAHTAPEAVIPPDPSAIRRARRSMLTLRRWCAPPLLGLQRSRSPIPLFRPSGCCSFLCLSTVGVPA